MTHRVPLACVIVLSLGMEACAVKPASLEGKGLTVLRGATLIDGTGAAPKPNAVVVLQRDRILRVGSEGQYRFPPDARVLDLSGRYITPGFIDTHVHSRYLPEIARTLLAFGITTIRSPSDENGVDIRHGLESGELLGPRLLTAGRLIDSPVNKLNAAWGPTWVASVTTEAEVREEVRRQAARGVDYIKVYMGMPPELLRAAVAEAHRRGLKAIGHLHCTGWAEAAEAGIDALVHTGSEGPSWELIDDPDATTRERAKCGDFGAYVRSWAIWAPNVDLHGPKVDQLVRALVDHHVEVNPTLVIMKSLYWGDDSTFAQRLEPTYAAPELRNSWGKDWEHSNPFMRPFNLKRDEWARLKTSFQSSKDLVRLFHNRGVLITAGSDVAMPWITPGVSFHHELELLHSAGISSGDVITIATQNGARALGLEGRIGSVQDGKLADLVVLTANPLDDIRATRTIELVVMSGRIYRPSELLK